MLETGTCFSIEHNNLSKSEISFIPPPAEMSRFFISRDYSLNGQNIKSTCIRTNLTNGNYVIHFKRCGHFCYEWMTVVRKHGRLPNERATTHQIITYVYLPRSGAKETSSLEELFATSANFNTRTLTLSPWTPIFKIDTNTLNPLQCCFELSIKFLNVVVNFKLSCRDEQRTV